MKHVGIAIVFVISIAVLVGYFGNDIVSNNAEQTSVIGVSSGSGTDADTISILCIEGYIPNPDGTITCIPSSTSVSDEDDHICVGKNNNYRYTLESGEFSTCGFMRGVNIIDGIDCNSAMNIGHPPCFISDFETGSECAEGSVLINAPTPSINDPESDEICILDGSENICTDSVITGFREKTTKSGLDNVADKVGAFSIASDVVAFGEQCNVNIDEIRFGGCEEVDLDGDGINDNTLCFDGIKQTMTVYVNLFEEEDIEKLKEVTTGIGKLTIISSADNIIVVQATQNEIVVISALPYVQSISEPITFGIFDLPQLDNLLSFFDFN